MSLAEVTLVVESSAKGDGANVVDVDVIEVVNLGPKQLKIVSHLYHPILSSLLYALCLRFPFVSLPNRNQPLPSRMRRTSSFHSFEHPNHSLHKARD